MDGLNLEISSTIVTVLCSDSSHTVHLTSVAFSFIKNY